jgi:hypothetical protein
MRKQTLWKWIHVCALIVSIAVPCFSAMAGTDSPHPKASQNLWQDIDKKWPPLNGWQGGFNTWPGPGDWKEGYKKWQEATSKRLEAAKSNKQAGKECDFIFSTVTRLLEQSKSARENPFRLERLLFASDALLNAGDFISWSRKTIKTPQDKDFWGVIGMALQGRYFRVQQADFFAPLSGEKNSDQYVKLARSLYQQARGAYDDRDYQKAKLLSDASESVVIALESIAQAAIPIPKPPPTIHK